MSAFNRSNSGSESVLYDLGLKTRSLAEDVARALGVSGTAEMAASSLVGANSANLDVARHLIELSGKTSDQDLSYKLIEEANQLIKNGKRINEALSHVYLQAKT